MSDLDVDALAAEFPEFDQPQKAGGRSARDERVIAGFEEIQRFVDQHGRRPGQGADLDIFERIYSVRLDRLREQEDLRKLLEPFDRQGLLSGTTSPVRRSRSDLGVEELVADFSEEFAAADDITVLKNVRSSEERQAAEEIANRTRCEDFATFKPMFSQLQKELDAGVRKAIRFERKSEIAQGRFYIVEGQTAYVADVGEAFKNDSGNIDARLRVIFSNGTESNLLMRSLQKALQQDTAGRRITDPVAGPLFADSMEDGDLESGTIYVLRSRSDLPLVAKNRDVLHKIGVTGGDLNRRFANAKLDPTFLMADVDVVATYRLANINRTKLENVIHRVFDAARLVVSIKDRFGNPVLPREWFLVPLSEIDLAIERIKDGSIAHYRYDPTSGSLVATGE